MLDVHPEDAERLLMEILRAATGGGRNGDWIQAMVAAVEATPDYSTVARRYAAATRSLRDVCAEPTAEQGKRLERCGLDALGRRGVTAMFRGALLLACCRRMPEETRAALVHRVFRTGDNDERVALLTVLPALPSPESYVETAVDACRSNVGDVFTAIACDNSYPARHFSDEAFNQMVMKTVFSGISLSRVRGLAGRVNPELERMARDYSAERSAAGREVPADLARLVRGQDHA